jgi:phosphoribosylformimino-5-aminoimidazole carboxamide ribotide isomerase
VELIPAIDLLGGRVVRLTQGDYDAVSAYGDDPVAMARRWESEGATRLHLVDLDGAREGRPAQAEPIARVLAAVDIPCQVAGGLRTQADAEDALARGADRVVMGSALLHDVTLARKLVAAHGPDRLVAALDVRDGRALGDGWVPDARGSDAIEHARRLTVEGVRWLAVTAVARDGTLAGPDVALLDAIRAAVPDAMIIASGGISGTSHVAELARRGLPAAILGRALYEGTLTLADARLAAASAATAADVPISHGAT